MADMYNSEFTGEAIDEAIATVREKSGSWDSKADGKHASQHAAGGEDPITPEAIGAATKEQVAAKADKAKLASISLPVESWVEESDKWKQAVTISGTTTNSKVDLQPDAAVIAQMSDDGTVALYISNDNGVLTANAVGEKPAVELTIQATITEVSA